jgi:GNAT superfamily N-acetyltransferase
VLELLAVHPDYQRMGAGTALVTWGVQVSDKLQVKSVVEGTPAGRRVYEKCGLSAEIEEMRFDVDEEFSDRAKPKLSFMTRRPLIT